MTSILVFILTAALVVLQADVLTSVLSRIDFFSFLLIPSLVLDWWFDFFVFFFSIIPFDWLEVLDFFCSVSVKTSLILLILSLWFQLDWL